MDGVVASAGTPAATPAEGRGRGRQRRRVADNAIKDSLEEGWVFATAAAETAIATIAKRAKESQRHGRSLNDGERPDTAASLHPISIGEARRW